MDGKFKGDLPVHIICKLDGKTSTDVDIEMMLLLLVTEDELGFS